MRKITKIEKMKGEEDRIRTVVYIRVSTDSEDQKLSFDMQKDHYEKEIKENPLYEY